MNTKGIMPPLFATIFILGLVAYISECTAASYRIGSMNNSQHFKKRKNKEWNEVHSGVFLEYNSGNLWLGVINYTNSFEDDSTALYFGKEYPLSDRVDLGWQAGIVSGYIPSPLPYGAFTLTYGIEHLKGRIVIIPAVVVGYQLFIEF